MNDLRKAVEQLVGRNFQTTGNNPGKCCVTQVTDSAVIINIDKTGNHRKIPMREIEDGLAYSREGKPMRPSLLRQAGVSEANPAYVAVLIPELRKVLGE